jgi:hypothetical protein
MGQHDNNLVWRHISDDNPVSSVINDAVGVGPTEWVGGYYLQKVIVTVLRRRKRW